MTHFNVDNVKNLINWFKTTELVNKNAKKQIWRAVLIFKEVLDSKKTINNNTKHSYLYYNVNLNFS